MLLRDFQDRGSPGIIATLHSSLADVDFSVPGEHSRIRHCKTPIFVAAPVSSARQEPSKMFEEHVSVFYIRNSVKMLQLLPLGRHTEVFMKKRILLNLSLVIVTAMSLIAFVHADETKENQETKKEKTFYVQEANLDLGKVAAGQDAVGTFIFHNDTEKDVKIIRAKPS